jgi:hypothetical protein
MTEPSTTAYRQRPLEAEAIQWTGTNEADLRAFAGSDFDTIDPQDRIEDPDQDAQLLVEASHWVGIQPGDWVLKFDGHFVAKSDVAFRAVWEPAVSSAPADRAAVLREAAARYEDMLAKATTSDDPRYWTAVRDVTLGLRRLAGEARDEQETQQTETEAQPPYHRWSIETRDAVADQWTPGTPIADRDKAVERYGHVTANWPTWKDGTPVERRLVRATTTYTVETGPAEAAQQPEAAEGAQQ